MVVVVFLVVEGGAHARNAEKVVLSPMPRVLVVHAAAGKRPPARAVPCPCTAAPLQLRAGTERGVQGGRLQVEPSCQVESDLLDVAPPMGRPEHILLAPAAAGKALFQRAGPRCFLTVPKGPRTILNNLVQKQF